MIAPRRPPPAYSSVRSSSARPIPLDWWSGSTTSSDRPHTPSRSMASAPPITRPSSSATHAPPGSVSIRWAEAHQRRVRRRRRRRRVVEARLEIGEGHHGDVVDGAGVLCRAWVGSSARRGTVREDPRLRLRDELLGLARRELRRRGHGRLGLLGLARRELLRLDRLLRLAPAWPASRRDRPSWPDPAAPSPPWPAWAASRPDRPSWPGPEASSAAWPAPEGRSSAWAACPPWPDPERPPWAGARAWPPPAWRALVPPACRPAAARGRARSGAAVDTWRVADPTAAAAGAACALRSAARGSGTGRCVASTPAVVPPPTSATATRALAASAPDAETAAAPPPAVPEPNAAPSAASLSPTVGITGSATASVLRCSATSSRNARQPAHSRRCRCSVVRRSAPPRRLATCSRISSHGVSRALRLAAKDVRAWNTSAFTFCRGTFSTSAISSWETAAELGQHERGALLLGQARDVAEQVAHVLAPLGLGREVLGGRRLVVRQRALAAGAQHREAAVAGDRVEPRPQLDLRVAAPRGGGRRP